MPKCPLSRVAVTVVPAIHPDSVQPMGRCAGDVENEPLRAIWKHNIGRKGTVHEVEQITVMDKQVDMVKPFL